MREEFIPKDSVYTPQQTSKYGLEAIDNIQKHKDRAVKLPIPLIGDYFAPMYPGQICAVQGQTSHYKSGFMHMWEHLLAKQLMEEKRDEIIIHISTEECIEEQAHLEFARHTGEPVRKIIDGEIQDWNRLKRAAVKVGTIPIYRIGDSLARAENMGELYLSNIFRSMKYMVNELMDKKLKVAAIFLDYIQALPIDPETKGAVLDKQRRLQVRSDVYRIKKMANFFECPVIFGSQAKQEMRGCPGSNMLIPGNYDSEETSSIGQRSDRIISLWLPKQTHTLGSEVQHKNIFFEIEENMLWVKVGKQRGGYPAGRTWMCRVGYNENTVIPDQKFHKLEYEAALQKGNQMTEKQVEMLQGLD